MTLTERATPSPPETVDGPAPVDTPGDRLHRRLVGGAVAACLGVVLIGLTSLAARPLDNADTWFHLRIGHELWGGWSLSQPGALSSFATTPWLPTQWSTEILAARAEDWFGLPGVAWLFGMFYLALAATLYLVCRSEAAPLPAALAGSLGVLGCGPAFSARPQVVSLLLLTLVVGAWLRTARTLRAPWYLVPLTWVWATAHGLWTAGVVVSVVCALGVVVDARPGRRAAARLFAVPVLCVAAACLTPLGPKLLLTQVAVGSRAPLISEWGPTSFRSPPAFVVAAMAGVVVLVWVRGRGRPVPWTSVLLLAVACGWAALVIRMVPAAAVIVAPLLAGALQGLSHEPSHRTSPRRREVALLVGAVGACLAVLAVLVPHTSVRPAGVPDGFTDRLAALPAGSPVAVQDLAGDWIEWRFPRLDPMLDGMLDAYPVDYIHRFSQFTKLQPGWQRFLASSGARVAVLDRGSALSAAMRTQLGWRVVDTDGHYLYLVAPRG